jgi:hypothetical protein
MPISGTAVTGSVRTFDRFFRMPIIIDLLVIIISYKKKPPERRNSNFARKTDLVR